MMAPEGEMDDSVFDVTIADQVSRLEIFGLLLKFMQGTQADHRAIHTYQTGSITVRAINGFLPAHADGETLCTNGQVLELSIVPRLFDVIVSDE